MFSLLLKELIFYFYGTFQKTWEDLDTIKKKKKKTTAIIIAN